MITSDEFRQLALALDNTPEKPQSDRIAFRVARNFAALAADGYSANIKLTPDEQEMKCLLAPGVFAPVDNAWGRQTDCRSALEMGRRHAQPKAMTKRRG